MSDHPSCIDISHWQGFPDFEEVAAQGVKACIMKATEGTSYVDPNRAENYIHATHAGIACCTYHWIKPGDASAQMVFYLNTVDPVPGERMVIDYEEDGCTLDDLHEAVEVLKADDRRLNVTVYSGHLLKEQLGDKHDALLAENTDLWLAQYTSGTPSWPTGTYNGWTLWQYSETGVVEGISDTHVDMNEFAGTDQELVAWINPQNAFPVPPKPRPLPDHPAVLIDVRATENVEVRVAVNGADARSLRRRRRRLLIPRRPDVR